MAFVESEVVELKAEVVGDICKEVIAFANTKGGTLYVGVKNDDDSFDAMRSLEKNLTFRMIESNLSL